MLTVFIKICVNMCVVLILQSNHVAYTRIVLIVVPEEMFFAHRASFVSKFVLCSLSLTRLVCFVFSDDFYFHLLLIERKIMHTFISFRFQSHTFQEKAKKNTRCCCCCCFFYRIFYIWRHIYVRVKFFIDRLISLPHSLRKRLFSAVLSSKFA